MMKLDNIYESQLLIRKPKGMNSIHRTSRETFRSIWFCLALDLAQEFNYQAHMLANVRDGALNYKREHLTNVL